MINKRRARRVYSEEFKKDAINLINQGSSIAEVGRNIGVSAGLIGKWKKHLNQAESIDINAMKLELKSLRKENKRLEMEREILKKAAAFFASEPK